MSDDSFNQPPHDPELICLQTAERLIAQNQWQLRTASELAAQAAAELQRARAEGRKLDLEAYLNDTYNEALYRACSGDEGPERQERGYTELWFYLQRAARHHYPDVADEAAQMALVATNERFADCRQPHSFRSFAFSCLMSAVKTLRRERNKTISLDEMLGEDGTLAELLPDRRFDPSQEVLRREQIDQLRQVIEELLKGHPRAVDQFKAFLWKYRDGLSDEEIARRLGTTVSGVHVLRSRWLKKLRELLRDDDNSDDEISS